MEKRKFKSEHSTPDDNHCFEQEAGGRRGGDVDVLEGRSQGSRKGSGGGGGSCCQVENCGADLSNAKQYHRRHRVCEDHAKAQVVFVYGIRQRFCQQCSRFHDISTSRKGAAGRDSLVTTSGGGSNPRSLPTVRRLPVGEWLVGRSTSRKMLHITNTFISTK